MKTGFFSIIIPTLNEEGYLPDILNDLKVQTQKNFEVIVVDGNSEDLTCELAKQYAKKLNISIIKTKPNLSHQRNSGAKAAQNPYLIFLDADTRVSRTFISKLKKEIDRSKYLIYLPTIIPAGGKYPDQLVFQMANLFVELSISLGKPLPSAGAMIFHRDYFHILGGYAEKKNGDDLFPEDHDIIMRAFNGGVKPKYLKHIEVLFSLRRIEKEGRLNAYKKYLTSGIEMTLKGKFEKKIEYKMGGQMYKTDEYDDQIDARTQKDLLFQIKQFMDKILTEE